MEDFGLKQLEPTQQAFVFELSVIQSLTGPNTIGYFPEL